jgi:2-phospho-L-lactate guanylyltransferase
VLVLPADLPAVSAAALDDLLARIESASTGGGARPEPTVGLVADRHGSGTNVLFLRPPGVIEPAFGAGSRVRHELAAIAVGARFVELGGPLSLDVDTAADLLEAEASLGSLRG